MKSLLKACVNIHGQIEKSQGAILCNLVAIEKKNGTVFPNPKCLEKAKNWANHIPLQLGVLSPYPRPILPPEQVTSLLWAAASPMAAASLQAQVSSQPRDVFNPRNKQCPRPSQIHTFF